MTGREPINVDIESLGLPLDAQQTLEYINGKKINFVMRDVVEAVIKEINQLL